MNHKWYSPEDSAAQYGVLLIIDSKIMPHKKESHHTLYASCISTQVMGCAHQWACTGGNKDKNLFSGCEDDSEVLQDQRLTGTVGEVDSVKGDGACLGPVVRRLFVRLPGCFTLQLCILHHSLHWCHLQNIRTFFNGTCRSI